MRRFRELMRVAELFEKWACKHVEFAHMTDTWPYLLKARFGSACLETMNVDAFASFDENDCLRVAFKMRLPIRVDDHLPVPVCVEAPNPYEGAKFARLRIQTVRADWKAEMRCTPEDDEPFDENFNEPFFGVYGVLANGKRELIADRPNYSAARNLLLALIPNIDLPKVPIAFGRALDVQTAPPDSSPLLSSAPATGKLRPENTRRSPAKTPAQRPAFSFKNERSGQRIAVDLGHGVSRKFFTTTNKKKRLDSTSGDSISPWG